MSEKHQEVQDYYGKELKSSADLQTNACCTPDAYPSHVKKTMGLIHDEVMSKYYGCGLTIPTALQGLSLLDLGSGSGRDCYLASHLVGEEGEVVGVDMTDEQLEVANRHLDYHAEKFGYKKSNIRFLKGNIEKLDELDLRDDQFDLIISNCVINLAEDKGKVLNDAFRLLKDGGEMYFSDVYADRRIPEHLQRDPVLYGECLSGALYWNDFLTLAVKAGFTDPRMVDSRRLTIENKELESKVGDIKFYSVTYRLFKVADLEKSCEDYGQTATYLGGIAEEASGFKLDDHHFFPKGRELSVCGNTYSMIEKSRFAKFFMLSGSFETHLGIFKGCGENAPFNEETTVTAGGSCC